MGDRSFDERISSAMAGGPSPSGRIPDQSGRESELGQVPIVIDRNDTPSYTFFRLRQNKS
jgi:hypothetical protein